MSFSWLDWSNPVALWWVFLAAVSTMNILFWLWSTQYLVRDHLRESAKLFHANPYLKPLLVLSGIYVFGCAFRSFLPRADVQRICLFDTWLSNVFVGRSVATVAELCFVAQWALVLNGFSKLTNSPLVEKISRWIVPLIFVAECFSWYGVITTHYLGNTIEESTWATTYTLIATGIFLLSFKLKGALRYAAHAAAFGCASYVLFMVTVDVPMYYTRWQHDLSQGKAIFGLVEGLKNLTSTWVVTYDIHAWKEEIPWMTLYFSVAVWTSIALCYLPLSKKRFAEYSK